MKKQTIIADLCDGGLKMPDVFAFHNAQKAMWIKRDLLNSNAEWKILFQQLCKLENYEFDHKLSINNLKCKSKSHVQVLDCWFKLKTKAPSNLNEILNEYGFLNAFMKIGNRSILPFRA